MPRSRPGARATRSSATAGGSSLAGRWTTRGSRRRTRRRRLGWPRSGRRSPRSERRPRPKCSITPSPSRRRPCSGGAGSSSAMGELTMVAALNGALRDALVEDDRVLVFGEDVGELGGVFRVTEGLQSEFGRERVFNTPIAEAGIAGICVGLAMAGWRPVAEMQFDGFSYPALDQVIGHVAKYRERTRGRVPMPVTIRIPSFGGIKGKEHHGESPETYYVHTAGLKVVVPSTSLDAYRLLRLAIADPDPVIVLEPKSRYWSKEDGDLTREGPGIGAARVLREGSACAIVTYGAMVAPCPRDTAAHSSH